MSKASSRVWLTNLFPLSIFHSPRVTLYQPLFITVEVLAIKIGHNIFLIPLIQVHQTETVFFSVSGVRSGNDNVIWT